jgi:hypothetical protein
MLERDLEWFEKNLKAIKFVRSDAIFNIIYDLYNDGFKWSVGYAYIEDYDGTYFFDDLVGEAQSLAEALDGARQRTTSVIDTCTAFRDEHPYTHDPQVGGRYVIIELSYKGRIHYRHITIIGINTFDQVMARDEHGTVLAYKRGLHKFFTGEGAAT